MTIFFLGGGKEGVVFPFRKGWDGKTYYTPSPLLIMGKISCIVFRDIQTIPIAEFTIITTFLETLRISEGGKWAGTLIFTPKRNLKINQIHQDRKIEIKFKYSKFDITKLS